MEQRLQKVEELKRGLKSQQALVKKAKSQSQAAVKASFILAEEIAKSARAFTEGDFIKNCMLKVCDEVCPEKKATLFKCEPKQKHHCRASRPVAHQSKRAACEKGKIFHRIFLGCG